MYRKLGVIVLTVLTSCSQYLESDYSVEEEGSPSEVSSDIPNPESSSLNLEGNFTCTSFVFRSVEERSDSMVVFMNRAKGSDLETKQKWDQMFFCSFPGSFNEMESLFGYKAKGGPAPLYDYPLGANVIQYFSQLTTIPDSIYYKKYVEININGIWQADNIREAFGLATRLSSQTKSVCEVLSEYSDDEVKSVFHFIFDGPHPKHKRNEELYSDLKLKIDQVDKRLSKLLTDSYNMLMARGDIH